MPHHETVYFIHAQRGHWRGIDTADPPVLVHELDPPMEMSAGTTNWILQTYAFLRKAGRDVALRERVVPGAINVIHVDHLSVKMRPYRGFVVAVQADRGRPTLCDLVVVQNHRNIVDPLTDFYMPHWTQPGLLARDASRGDRLERVGYIGLEHNLHASLREEGFHRTLRDEGFELVMPAMQDWHDYRALDAVVSIRSGSSYKTLHKPATKLFNAWRACVVPMMGVEDACRAAGEPGVDYVEVEDAEQVLAALRRLRAEPGWRASLLEQGRRQAGRYTPEAIGGAWMALLDGPVRRAYRVYRARQWAIGPVRAAQFPLRAWRHKQAQRAYWKATG